MQELQGNSNDKPHTLYDSDDAYDNSDSRQLTLNNERMSFFENWTQFIIYTDSI